MSGIDEMLKDVLKDVRDLLEYQATLGLTEVPILTASTSTSASTLTSASTSTLTSASTSTLTSASSLVDPVAAARALEALRLEIGDCQRCRLGKGRTKLAFGVGNPCAEVMFIGEGPGRDEDLQGEPFVGAAGQLLTKIIEAMGFRRDEVYIANIVKCRPPNNRNPEADEAATCMPYLVRQAEIVQPKVIVCLGSVAVQNLLATERKITSLRGKWQEWRGIPVMPTFHPAFLLRNAAMKKPVWEDMQLVLTRLGRTPPAR